MRDANTLLVDLPPYEEVIDDDTMEFVSYPEITVELEHSLFTIFNWESKWKKAFLGDKPKTDEEMTNYVYWMIKSPEMDEKQREITARRIGSNIELARKIQAYIQDGMTATNFSELGEENRKKGRDVLTSEYCYYIIFSNQIDIKVEHWHLNRLLTLFRVFFAKNPMNKQKNRSQREIMADYERINARNRAKFHTKG